ncbi:MAG: MarR family transcriptional regulator [Bowdeniella nasicola]|nr:MarR family transcriptional regulator [Bowdeniella nasicola]
MPSSTPVTPAPGEDDLTALVRVAVHRISRRLRQEARAAADLSQTHICVLAYLEKNGPATPGELAEEEGVQPPSMTRIINSLQESDCLTRSAHPSDKRQVLVELTAPGRELLTQMRQRRSAWLSAGIENLTPAQRNQLRASAELLLEMVER